MDLSKFMMVEFYATLSNANYRKRLEYFWIMFELQNV
jgi:hypothetical protein